eukprot:1076644-Amphidinium_carterae.1
MLVIVTKITKNADGVSNQFFEYEFYQSLKDLEVRDGPTYSNVDLLSKQVLGPMQNRLRKLSTLRVALRTTLSSKEIDHLLLPPMLKIVCSRLTTKRVTHCNWVVLCWKGATEADKVIGVKALPGP